MGKWDVLVVVFLVMMVMLIVEVVVVKYDWIVDYIIVFLDCVEKLVLSVNN